MNPTAKPDLVINLRMKGEYRCVLNEGTDHEVDTGWFDNLITNGGLDKLGGTLSGIFSNVSIGTGTTTPANSDTSLTAYVAHKTNVDGVTQGNAGSPNYESQFQVYYIFAQGDVVGNMAEVGIGWNSDGTGLWSHARILDGGGSPTTLTVTALDQLTVYYKLRCFPVLTDITGTVTLSGTDYAYTGRIAAASALTSLFGVLNGGYGIRDGAYDYFTVYPADSVLGAITDSPTAGTGGESSCGTSVNGTYTSGNKYRDSTFTVAPSDGNRTGGIGCIRISYLSSHLYFQYKFTTPIPKDNTKTLTLVSRISWDRV